MIWLPERSILRAGAPGFISQVVEAPGTQVRAGQTLVWRDDPALEAQIVAQQARVAELEASYGVEFVNDRARADLVRQTLQTEQATLARARERAAALPVVAGVDGTFALPAAADLRGRWHRRGEVLGYVLGADEPVVRVVVEQADADLVSHATRAVAVRLADNLDRVLAARIVRQVPEGRDEAPSRALVASAGGQLAGDPRDPQGRKTLERIFQFDLALLEPLGHAPAFGQRVHVRFELEPAPLATQAWRAGRRLFLRHFDV